METKTVKSGDSSLFKRVAAILDSARAGAVRSINSQMVIAYWLTGREIVEEEQKGEKRAAYGKQVVEDLAERLTQRYGKGFSASNLWLFRQFYLSYTNRKPDILDTVCREFDLPGKLDTLCGESSQMGFHRLYRGSITAFSCGWKRMKRVLSTRLRPNAIAGAFDSSNVRSTHFCLTGY